MNQVAELDGADSSGAVKICTSMAGIVCPTATVNAQLSPSYVTFCKSPLYSGQLVSMRFVAHGSHPLILPTLPPASSSKLQAQAIPSASVQPLCNSKASAAGRAQAAVARASAILDPPAASDTQTPVLPTSAETARTIVDIVRHGTLCTVSDAGLPLGTSITYVLDVEGEPILRLRADAVHTANLGRNPKCSLFVQPQDLPARLLARATLIGQVRCFAIVTSFEHGKLTLRYAAVCRTSSTDPWAQAADCSCQAS